MCCLMDHGDGPRDEKLENSALVQSAESSHSLIVELSTRKPRQEGGFWVGSGLPGHTGDADGLDKATAIFCGLLCLKAALEADAVPGDADENASRYDATPRAEARHWPQSALRYSLNTKHGLDGCLCRAHQLLDFGFGDHQRGSEVQGIAGRWMRATRGSGSGNHAALHHLGL